MRLTAAHGLGVILGALFPLSALALSPAFGDHFTVAKWVAVYAVAALATATLGVAALPWRRPRLPRWLVALAMAGVGSLTCAYVMHKGLIFSKVVADRLSIALLILAFFAYLQAVPDGLLRLGKWVTLAATAVVGIGLAQALRFDVLALAGLPSDGRSSTFGNVNMASQFLGAALLAVFVVRARTRTRGACLGLDVLAALTVTYLLLMLNRSVWIAVASSLAFLVGERTLLSWRQLARIAVLVAVALVGLNGPRVAQGIERGWGEAAAATSSPTASVGAAGISPIDEIGTVATGEAKMSSVRSRLRIWGSTVALIAANPFGIGPGAFEFGAAPYQKARGVHGPTLTERTVFKSPHNDYLLLAAENGVIALMALLAFAVAVLWRVWWLPTPVGSKAALGRERRAFILCLSLYFGVEALFQFPLDNAFSVTFLALGAALALDYAYQAAPRRRPPGLLSTVIVALLATSLSWSAWRYAWSNHLTLRRGYDAAALTTACRLDPYNWRACIGQAYQEYASGEADRARVTLAAVLSRQAYVFPAQKLLAQIDLATGWEVRGCDGLRRYDAWFAGGSSVRKQLERRCAPASAH